MQASNGAGHAGRTVTSIHVVTVNDQTDSHLARQKEDIFGRAMTTFRRAHTARDTQPLPRRGQDDKAEQWCRKRKEDCSASIKDSLV